MIDIHNQNEEVCLLFNLTIVCDRELNKLNISEIIESKKNNLINFNRKIKQTMLRSFLCV